jgi:hypothetical protein
MPFKSEKQRKFMFANEPEIAKKWAKEYNQGGVASMFRKKLEDGDLSPEIISQIESMAATGVDASTISTLVGVSEEQVNNVLSSGNTSEVMPVEGEEMVETAEVTEEADPLLNLFQQNDSLNNDQSMTTLFNTAENPVNANMTGQPVGIMAAKGGRIGFRGGGQDAGKDSDFGSENYGGNNNNNNNNNNDNSGPVYSPHTDTPEQIAGQKTIDIQRDIDRRNEEKYDDSLDQFYGVKRSQTKQTIAKEKYNTVKKDLQDRFKNNLGKKAVSSFVAGKLTFGITDVLGSLKTAYDLDVNKKEYESILNEVIAEYEAAGIPAFTPHTDTLIQIANQELIDINPIRDKDEEGEPDGIQPYIAPVTLEVDENYAQGENLDYNMQSALDKIRANQARRSGAVATGNIQDNEIMMANRGGLAGLFRVKNQ